MLTGHATFETAIDGMKLGAFDYLMKPCEIDDLTTKLDAARKRHQEHLDKILEASGKELRGQRAR
jgi:ActR/RegA family two-component response regulator